MGQRNRQSGATAFCLGRTLDAVAAVDEAERATVVQLAAVRRLKALLKDTCGRLDSDTAPYRDVSADELAAHGEPISIERARAKRRAN